VDKVENGVACKGGLEQGAVLEVLAGCEAIERVFDIDAVFERKVRLGF
jgi:hypothetical protein